MQFASYACMNVRICLFICAKYVSTLLCAVYSCVCVLVTCSILRTCNGGSRNKFSEEGPNEEAVWLFGRGVAYINEVTLRRAGC